ncbi:MAG: Imm51 family immunity protein [Planctomycetota bacterium]
MAKRRSSDSTKRNDYFPCILVEQDEDFSVICSDLHYFDEHFSPREPGGYNVESLAKKLVKENQIEGVKFDSEASMFCAYSDKKTPLKKLCGLLRKITGGEARHLAKESPEPKIPLEEAEVLLLQGFVVGNDVKAQKKFLKNVPCPALSKNQEQWMKWIQSGSDAEKIQAARKINCEARTKVRHWEHYLSHPQTTEQLLTQCDQEDAQGKVYMEILWALVFICERHLPDNRCEVYFLRAVENTQAQTRALGIMGLDSLGRITKRLLKPMLDDKSKKVRQCAEMHLRWLEKNPSRGSSYPSWMFEAKLVKSARAKVRAKK